MTDEGVHEIQLNGKQLVFMFMAVTVVAVVIFLCGVMVGRGVRAPRPAEATEASADTPADPTAAQTSPIATEASGSTSGTPVTSDEKLTYTERLSTSTPPPETLRTEPIPQALSASERAPVEAITTKAAVAPKPAAKIDKRDKTDRIEAKAKADTKAAAARSSGVAGTGFVVQVTAVRARGEADTIAKRLASKGFPSYVTIPGPGAPAVYRVRVGKYTDRREAETVAHRLEKEEQFKPWITR
ncbi:MAG TPA: SPOR domain-containing protein [Vicinamibacterales bacterium]|jgi:cell division septation protein DedD